MRVSEAASRRLMASEDAPKTLPMARTSSAVSGSGVNSRTARMSASPLRKNRAGVSPERFALRCLGLSGPVGPSSTGSPTPKNGLAAEPRGASLRSAFSDWTEGSTLSAWRLMSHAAWRSASTSSF